MYLVYQLFLRVVILLSVLAWVIIAYKYFQVIRKTPKIVGSVETGIQPKVSIIVPARNEEKYITAAITSLSNQRYRDYEIILVDDASKDSTPLIIRGLANNEPRIKVDTITDRPEEWTGKNWACHLGFKKSVGDILLFTDADIEISETLLRDSVAYLVANRLDALTLIPKVRTFGLLSKFVQPTLGVIMSVFFSPLAVNDPESKLGYFWGSFFLISRRAYEIIGGHEAVKGEIVEDRALGQRTKDANLKLRMLDGSNDFSAVWARSASSLWRNFERITYPSMRNNPLSKITYVGGVSIILIPPFLVFLELLIQGEVSSVINASLSVTSIFLMVISSAYQAKHRLGLGYRFGLGVPFALTWIFSNLLVSALRRRDGKVTWKERVYRFHSRP